MIQQLFDSMAKVVFLLMTLALVAALFTDKITGEQFLPLAAMVFTFYFAAPTGGSGGPIAGAK